MSGIENMLSRMSHDMNSYFANQGFIPPPYPPIPSPSDSFVDAPDEDPE